MATDRVIIGIDPGTQIMGYGILKITGKQLDLLCCDVLNLKRSGDHYIKLHEIFRHTTALIEEYKPDELAIEAPFYGKNVQSMLKLGRAQGVAIAAAINRKLPVFEYSPKRIKQSITGNGNASKEQVAQMLRGIVNNMQSQAFLDATDGLAAAVCHYFQRGPREQIKKYSGWEGFINSNPSRKLTD